MIGKSEELARINPDATLGEPGYRRTRDPARRRRVLTKVGRKELKRKQSEVPKPESEKMGAFTRIKRPLSRKKLIQDIGRRGRAALKSGREDAEYEFKSRASGRTPGKPHPDHGKPFPEKAITAWKKSQEKKK